MPFRTSRRTKDCRHPSHTSWAQERCRLRDKRRALPAICASPWWPLRTKIAPSQSLVISALTEPNPIRQKSRRDRKRAWRGAPDGVATLKLRKGTFDALNKGSGALGKWSKVVAPSGAPPEELYEEIEKGVPGSDSEIATRNRKSLATFHRTLQSHCSIAQPCLGGNR